MEKKRLFDNTIRDIEAKLKSNDPYEILMISALLRKLLLDSYPLMDQVNEERRLKITFKVNTRPINPLLTEADFWSIQDGFDPDTSHFSIAQDLSRDKMLERRVLKSDGHWFTVRDLIDFLSNVGGAVHAGKPDDKQKVLQGISSKLRIGVNFQSDLTPVIRATMSIARVVIKGLQPLRS